MEKIKRKVEVVIYHKNITTDDMCYVSYGTRKKVLKEVEKVLFGICLFEKNTVLTKFLIDEYGTIITSIERYIISYLKELTKEEKKIEIYAYENEEELIFLKNHSQQLKD